MSFPSVQDTQTVLQNQMNAAMTIPSQVLGHWPMFLALGFTSYLTAMVLEAVPNVQGFPGKLVNYSLIGAAKVADMITYNTLAAVSVLPTHDASGATKTK